jgi:hypothetical protein
MQVANPFVVDPRLSMFGRKNNMEMDGVKSRHGSFQVDKEEKVKSQSIETSLIVMDMGPRCCR